MSYYIRMSTKKYTITLILDGPILPGSISTAKSTCGKPNCACKERPPRLHGKYYRWTGFADGKRTTITITEEEAEECQKRIKNYRELQKKLDALIKKAISEAPWKARAQGK